MHGPYVNLNGASRESLIEQHKAVYYAASALRDVLAQAAPHGRDYQTCPDPYNYAQDRLMWEAHRKAVEALVRDYERIAIRLVTEER
jgi:hypothetical protein